MVGFVFIILAHIIALLGYLIMPDDTPFANDGSALIKKKPVGFKAKIMKVRISREIEEVSFIERMYLGQESKYTIQPVDTVYIKDLTVYYKLYDKELGWERELLKQELLMLIQKGWVKGLQKETEEEIDNYSQFDTSYSLYLYLATKDGLMAHNSR